MSEQTSIPAKRKFRDVPMVKLIAGDEESVFNVHESVLFEASPVFKAAFNSNFREATERSMRMPDETADDVEIFINRLYAPGPKPLETAMELYIDESLRVYVIAEKYDAQEMMKAICRAITCLMLKTTPPPIDTVIYIFRNTTEKSSIRQILASWYIRHIEPDWIPSEETYAKLMECPELIASLIVYLPVYSMQRRYLERRLSEFGEELFEYRSEYRSE